VLILECSMPDERKVSGHLTPSECGRIAAEAGCRHLVLTHFYPVVRNGAIRARVRRAFAGRLTLARDFTEISRSEISPHGKAAGTA
jgi:ribonuclease BN (tRNA processing enzyme)